MRPKFAMGIALALATAFADKVAAQAEAPSLHWEQALDGEVHSSLLAGDRIFLVTVKPGAAQSTLEARAASDGSLAWAAPVASNVSLGPAHGADLIVTERGRVVALDMASGKERWVFVRPLEEGNAHRARSVGFDSPAISAQGGLYVADYAPDPVKKDAVGPSTVFCLAPATGEERWRLTIPTGVIRAGLVASGHLVVVTREFGFSLISTSERRVLWSNPLNSVRVPATLGADAVYLPDHGIHAVSVKDGSVLWARQGTLMPFELTLKDGVLYGPLPQPIEDVRIRAGEKVGRVRNLGDYVPTFVALSPRDGTELWERAFPDEIRAGTVTDDAIYLACWDNHLYRLRRHDGAVDWKFPLELDTWAPTPWAHGDRVILAFKQRLLSVRIGG